jgi:hypothetical protein
MVSSFFFKPTGAMPFYILSPHELVFNHATIKLDLPARQLTSTCSLRAKNNKRVVGLPTYLFLNNRVTIASEYDLL